MRIQIKFYTPRTMPLSIYNSRYVYLPINLQNDTLQPLWLMVHYEQNDWKEVILLKKKTAAEVKGQTFCSKNCPLKIFLLVAIKKSHNEQCM